MKKNLLKVLLACLILFSLTACGGAKKDPEVVKKIIGIVKKAVDYYNVPQKDIEITSSSNFMDMDKKEQELAKNIKIEVTDVFTVDEYIEIYIENIKRTNMEKEKLREKVNDIAYMPSKIPTKEELKEKYKNQNIDSFYKYTVTADVIKFEEEIKMPFGLIDIEAGKKMLEIETKALAKENIPNLKYETVEIFGIVGYNSKDKELVFVRSGLLNTLGEDRRGFNYITLGKFLKARWNIKYI